MNKNDLIELSIEDMSDEGLGIGHAGGMAFFLKDTVVGDRVRARITALKKSYGFARAEEILKPSAERVQARCPAARRCGGCQLQEMSYEAQLRLKENKVRSNLRRLGSFTLEGDRILGNTPPGAEPEESAAGAEDAAGTKKTVDEHEPSGTGTPGIFLPVIGMEEPWKYRNKAQFPIGYDRSGKLTAGFYAGRTHDIIDIRRCVIGIDENQFILETVLGYMEKYHVTAYDEKSRKGIIRHVMTRAGFATGQLMVVIVAAADSLPKESMLVDALLGLNCGIRSIVLNTNKAATNVIMGDRVRALYGEDFIEDRIGDVIYRISSRSFYQVNPVQTRKLYETVLEYAGLTGREAVWDLYCGIGTISLFLSQKARSVTGVEVVPDAIANARKNAELNHIDNVRFITGRAEDVLPQAYRGQTKEAVSDESAFRAQGAAGSVNRQGGIAEAETAAALCAAGSANRQRGIAESAPAAGSQMLERPDVIVVDPPRKGLEKAVIGTMIEAMPSRIVYVSCDSATLARDLRQFADGGYRVDKVRPVDMFPHTVHVETVALLSKLNQVEHVDVLVDMNELDLTAAESKPTYREIQDYVKQQTGLNVSNLNVAQVKRKYGLIERANYNLPKKEKSRTPGCLPEKEEAIVEALKHFGCIGG